VWGRGIKFGGDALEQTVGVKDDLAAWYRRTGIKENVGRLERVFDHGERYRGARVRGRGVDSPINYQRGCAIRRSGKDDALRGGEKDDGVARKKGGENHWRRGKWERGGSVRGGGNAHRGGGKASSARQETARRKGNLGGKTPKGEKGTSVVRSWIMEFPEWRGRSSGQGGERGLCLKIKRYKNSEADIEWCTLNYRKRWSDSWVDWF